MTLYPRLYPHGERTIKELMYQLITSMIRKQVQNIE